MSHVVIWTETFQAKKTASAKAPDYSTARRHKWLVGQVYEERKEGGVLLGCWKDLSFCSECDGSHWGGQSLSRGLT